MAPRLSAGSPTLHSGDPTTITRIDITVEDIRNMSDQQLSDHLSQLRRNRETMPVKRVRVVVKNSDDPDSESPRLAKAPKEPKAKPVQEEEEIVEITFIDNIG